MLAIQVDLYSKSTCMHPRSGERSYIRDLVGSGCDPRSGERSYVLAAK
jgi:hypothetical protein